MKLHHLTATVSAVSGGGMAQDLYRAAAPRGILEHIINFFTFGGVRRQHTSDINIFIRAFAEELVYCWDGRSPIPDTIDIELKNAFVTFKVKTSSPAEIQVKILERRERMYEETTIDAKVFEKVITVLWLRERYALCQNEPTLTSGGRMNLRNLRLEGADLSGMHLRSADFSGCQLQNVNFRTANISRALFYDANINGCDFTYAHCYMARFLNCDTRQANFKHANYNNIYSLKKPPLFDKPLLWYLTAKKCTSDFFG